MCNIASIRVFRGFSAKLRAAESNKQTVSSRDSCLRAYMEVFTACLRFEVAAARTSRRVHVLQPQTAKRRGGKYGAVSYFCE